MGPLNPSTVFIHRNINNSIGKYPHNHILNFDVLLRLVYNTKYEFSRLGSWNIVQIFTNVFANHICSCSYVHLVHIFLNILKHICSMLKIHLYILYFGIHVCHTWHCILFRYPKKISLFAPIFYAARLWVQTPNGHWFVDFELNWVDSYFAQSDWFSAHLHCPS